MKNGNGPVCNSNPPDAWGSSKIESFSAHGNHYLLFIGPHDTRIFWWLKSQFIEFQKILNTAFACEVAVAYLPSNEAIISLVSNSNHLRLEVKSNLFVNRLNGMQLDELRLSGLLSGVNLTNLLKRAVYLDERSSYISVPIIINDQAGGQTEQQTERLRSADL